MICPICGCVFCDDDGDERGPYLKIYCTETCKRRAKKRRHKGQTPEQARANVIQDAMDRSMAVSCPRKQRYESPADALTALRWLREEGRADGKAGIYPCTACDGWHITGELRWSVGSPPWNSSPAR